jgi:DNA-binding PadR family transcriptional regulator
MPRRPSRQTLSIVEVFLETPDTWHYGYDLSKRLGMPSGTLYPILARLSERELLETRWVDSETDGRPPRHMYRLTTAGRSWSAEVTRESLQQLRIAAGLT